MRRQSNHCASTSAELLDRRRSVRVPHRASFVLRRRSDQGAASGQPVEVILQDLSATGIGALHGEALPIGQQFEIPLDPPVPVSLRTLLCTVVRCERLDDGLFSIGFIFNSPQAVIDAGSRQLTGRAAQASD